MPHKRKRKDEPKEAMAQRLADDDSRLTLDECLRMTREEIRGKLRDRGLKGRMKVELNTEEYNGRKAENRSRLRLERFGSLRSRLRSQLRLERFGSLLRLERCGSLRSRLR